MSRYVRDKEQRDDETKTIEWAQPNAWKDAGMG